MNCRLCDGPTTVAVEREDVTLHRCRSCRFVSGAPSRQATAPDRYRHYYRGDPPPPPDYRYDEWLREAERRIGRGRLLEIGAGSGAFVRVAMRRGWSVAANEVSETGLARLRESGAEIFEGTVEAARFADHSFDLVVSLEVLEHLPDPASHLRELARVTRAGGALLLSTPNFDGLSRRWLGARWRVIEPGHLGYFTPRTLRSALRGAGYRRVRVRSRTLDVSTWRRSVGTPAGAAPSFDPQASARLRDSVQSRPVLRAARESVNVLLGLTGLGDSLLVWAVR
jgi:2-polyprenyl-3-methyl-5-hydroxy-6-metoxy-1,4-benzoquinol methylase